MGLAQVRGGRKLVLVSSADSLQSGVRRATADFHRPSPPGPAVLQHHNRSSQCATASQVPQPTVGESDCATACSKTSSLELMVREGYVLENSCPEEYMSLDIRFKRIRT